MVNGQWPTGRSVLINPQPLTMARTPEHPSPLVRRQLVQPHGLALAQQSRLVALHHGAGEVEGATCWQGAFQAAGDEVLQLLDEALEEDRLVLQRRERVL